MERSTVTTVLVSPTGSRDLLHYQLTKERDGARHDAQSFLIMFLGAAMCVAVLVGVLIHTREQLLDAREALATKDTGAWPAVGRSCFCTGLEPPEPVAPGVEATPSGR